VEDCSQYDLQSLLRPLDAAAHLGITPALLFAYVTHPPKRILGHTRHLPTVQLHGKTMFRATDLQEFDSYLKEPWSATADDRPPIPRYVSEHLQVECGGQCPRCGKGFKLENAHINDYAKSLSHHHHNLIRLCSHCHDEFDSKTVLLHDEICRLKQSLIEQTRQRIQRHTAASTRGITAPPSPEPLFQGRETQLKAICKALENHRTICVLGAAGIGKTELVLNALLRRTNSIHPILWVTVETVTSVSDLEFCLRSAIAAMVQPGRHSLGQLLDQLACTVVFDGVEAITAGRIEELEDFFSLLIKQSAKAQFIFTSQVDLHAVPLQTRLPLDPVGESASRKIIQHASGMPKQFFRTAKSETAWLLTFCEGHPLTLRIVAALLRYFKSAATVVERIQRCGASTVQTPGRQVHTKRTSLNVSLAASYSALDNDEKELLYLASQCPAGYVDSVRPAMGAVPDTRNTIAILEQWHLISTENYSSDTFRLRMISPIRAFCKETFETDHPSRANDLMLALTRSLVMQAMVIHEHYFAVGDVTGGNIRFAQEFPNLIHIFEQAVSRSEAHPGYRELIGALASSLQEFCFVNGLNRRHVRIARLGADAAKQVGAYGAAAHMLLQLIVLGERQHDLKLAKRSAKELNELAAMAPDQDILADAAMGNGDVALQEGRFSDAKLHFQEAISLYHSVDNNMQSTLSTDSSLRRHDQYGFDPHASRHGVALATMQLAFSLEKAKQYSEAVEAYRSALSIMLESRDVINSGSVLHQLGNCHADLKENSQAFESYWKASKTFFEISAVTYLSNSLSELGYLLIDYDPGKSLDTSFPTSLLEAGLIDALGEADENFPFDNQPLNAPVCIGTIRKLFGITALISFTNRPIILRKWADTIKNKIVQPFANTRKSTGVKLSSDALLIMHLDFLHAIAGTISHCSPGSGTPRQRLTLAEHLARLCYRQYDYAWRTFRLFDWLAVYLQRQHGFAVLSADALRIAAALTEENHEAFRLPDSPEQHTLFEP
jgi:tetratricopeptide (TPR) repeat protein